MTKNSRRFWCIALVLALLTGLLPAVTAGMMSAQAESKKYGMTTKDKVNFRVGPGTDSKFLFKLSAGHVCEVLGTVTKNKVLWYQVKTKSPEAKDHTYYGYVKGDCFRMLTDEEEAAWIAGKTVATPTPVPDTTDGSPTPTPTPAANVDSPAAEGATGYITNGGVNLRSGPGKTKVLMKLNRGDIVSLLTVPSIISDDTYYKVSFNGITGYVMSTFVNPNGTSPVTTKAPSSVTPTPTPEGAIGFVQTTKGGVKLRATIGGTVIQTLGKYEVYPYLLKPVKKNGYKWYFIQVGKRQGYVRGDCVRIVTDTSTSTPKATDTPAGATPTPTPKPTAEPAGYVKTTVANVNVRKTANGVKLGTVEKQGTLLPYYGTPTKVKNVTWYCVYLKPYGNCYIHGSYVIVTDKNGTAVATPTPTPGPTNSGSVTPPPDQQEASYNTLKLGSSGTAVKNLVTELKNQGYYSGSITSNYTSAGEEAVRAFQTAKGLTADGIAGSATQHKLFGTVPIGTADTSNLTMTLYPAEKIDWNTGGINELWAKGSNYKIYDVKTGIVWWAHRWSGGLHVDAEPLTAADTARLCKIYGVSKASEINSKEHYQRRPCLVTIGTRTFACSLYGVPHNDAGDTISDNNYKGQLCIHFTNSKTHESRKVDSGHQEAIEYAWLNAPNGHI